MINHDELLASLRPLFPDAPGAPGIKLIGRYRDAALNLASRWTLVFLPDMHLLDDADATSYPKYHFSRNPQGTNLEATLRALATLRGQRPGQLLVYQLGDLFDVWRARSGATEKLKVDSIAGAHSAVIDLLRSSPPLGVKARLLAGNHDYVIHHLPDWQALRFELISASAPGAGDVLVVHGDAIDWAEEAAPDELQAWAVRLASDHDGGTRQFDLSDQRAATVTNQRLAAGDEVIGLGLTQYQDHGLLGAVADIAAIGADLAGLNIGVDPRTRFFRQAATAARLLKQHGHDVRVVVIGHTHSARMVYGDRGDGQRMVLMDCGAWFGKCKFGAAGADLWAQQLGVLADNDLRIYQLGHSLVA